MPEKSHIYCDYAAGGPPRPEVFEAMRSHAFAHFANPGAHHPLAYLARHEMERLHRRAAAVLGVDPREVIFTSGGTESDVLALRGMLPPRPLSRGGREVEDARRFSRRDELVVSAIEHHAVLLCAEKLAREGFCVRYAGVNSQGLVDVDQLDLLISERTALVSVMLANNETGVIQPVREVARRAHAKGAKFHCDAVQAFGKVDLKPRDIGCDLLSLSGGKFGGPKGTGLLYNEMTNRLDAQMVGGPQEWGYRAGTENLGGQAGLALAMELAEAEREKVWPRVAKIRDALEGTLKAKLGARVRINGEGAPRLPNISNVSFLGVEGQALGIELGEQGYCVGLGSACAPGETDPSHVLRAMGLSWEDAQGCIRFSFGPEITEAQGARLADLCVANYLKLAELA